MTAYAQSLPTSLAPWRRDTKGSVYGNSSKGSCDENSDLHLAANLSLSLCGFYIFWHCTRSAILRSSQSANCCLAQRTAEQQLHWCSRCSSSMNFFQQDSRLLGIHPAHPRFFKSTTPQQIIQQSLSSRAYKWTWCAWNFIHFAIPKILWIFLLRHFSLWGWDPKTLLMDKALHQIHVL